MAIGLPQSPIGAIAFILVVLALSYAVLRVLIRTDHPFVQQESDFEDPMPEGETQAPVSYGSYESPSILSGADTTGTEPVPPVEKPYAVEAISIRGLKIATGDEAGYVMRAVRRNESAAMPIIDRHASGYAVRVRRKYRTAGQELTIVFQRRELPGRLLLVEIGVKAV